MIIQKLDQQKIEKAFQAFTNNFNEEDLLSANKEIKDIVNAYFFTNYELQKFLLKIKQYLSSKGISLDSLS